MPPLAPVMTHTRPSRRPGTQASSVA
jgi:hypothetical protein